MKHAINTKNWIFTNEIQTNLLTFIISRIGITITHFIRHNGSDNCEWRIKALGNTKYRKVLIRKHSKTWKIVRHIRKRLCFDLCFDEKSETLNYRHDQEYSYPDCRPQLPIYQHAYQIYQLQMCLGYKSIQRPAQRQVATYPTGLKKPWTDTHHTNITPMTFVVIHRLSKMSPASDLEEPVRSFFWPFSAIFVVGTPRKAEDSAPIILKVSHIRPASLEISPRHPRRFFLTSSANLRVCLCGFGARNGIAGRVGRFCYVSWSVGAAFSSFASLFEFDAIWYL